MTKKQAQEVTETVQKTMPTEQRVSDLEDAAIYYYWNDGQLKKNEKKVFKGITIKSNFDVIEQLFKEAIKIDPQNLNLQMDLASTYRMQNNNAAAAKMWQNILKKDHTNFDARLKLAAFSSVTGDKATYDDNIAKLQAQNAEKTATFTKAFSQIDEIGKLDIQTKIPNDLPKDSHHYFVVLGYALSSNGKMQPTMKKRLEIALKAAKKYPKSKILVAGGVPENKLTEATVMQKWLVAHGIAKKRIELEDLSTNTVENALFSVRELVDRGATSATLITSATHMRRAFLLYQMAGDIVLASNTSKNDKAPVLTQVAYVDDKKILNNYGTPEKNAIMDDVLRLNGVWQLPGLQR
ncbi:ElyC/SanA/YdcF family protein [Lacticaseibacillus paracasei]|uniref:ElyC/SanA/YdcF family protein n=1 Tax=Lacticaseibacillus paracasei TaxID=1597 RepID=UPI00097823FA|nr:ElyC/SanA/YdcF family protein [Lacticaseibacillus paracasei]MDK6822136.1 ElyC/SanA/YdcF family protein [Lacticaseibacillus paracasei]MDK7799079.1 ElyC/SanA/YdcF family protein [Lacticaseibacillus paracasei]UYX02247.1 YdcF family protein [Lacticaseibacillus paracasei subsp. tolerans]UYX05221.1 YdcF family protein [Lacticaseibacillus paracasei subsp. tolerans]